MIRPTLLALALATIALATIVLVPAAHADERRSIAVQGNASAVGRPDMATARTGIESRGATPEAALAANTKVMNALLAVIKRHGIAERDFETTSFDVNPVYAQASPRGPAAIEGYQVTNQVSVRVRDIAKLGGLLSSFIEAGANRLNGVSFEIADPAPLLEQARKAAVADARRRAELYAAAAGVKVARVLSISEGGSFTPPQPMALRAMKAGADAVPVAGGEQAINASVSVVYEIE